MPARVTRTAAYSIIRRIMATKRTKRTKRQTLAKAREHSAMMDRVPDSQDSWRIFRIMSEFVEGFEVMAKVGPAVSIFGSARTSPDQADYKAAEETARLL